MIRSASIIRAHGPTCVLRGAIANGVRWKSVSSRPSMCLGERINARHQVASNHRRRWRRELRGFFLRDYDISMEWNTVSIAVTRLSETVTIRKGATRTLVTINVEYIERTYIYKYLSRIAVLEKLIGISESDYHIRANSYFSLLVLSIAWRECAAIMGIYVRRECSATLQPLWISSYVVPDHIINCHHAVRF